MILEIMGPFRQEILDFMFVLIKISFPGEDLGDEIEFSALNFLQVEEFVRLKPQKVLVLFLLAKEEDMIILISREEERMYLALFLLRIAGKERLTKGERAHLMHEFFSKEIRPVLDSEIVLSAIVSLEDRYAFKGTCKFPDYRW